MTFPRSWMWMMFGWFSCAASLASVRNIRTKLFLSPRCGRMRLSTTVFSKPSGPIWRARKISAIPPTAMRSRRRYFPYCCSRMPTRPQKARVHSAERRSAQRRGPEAHGAAPRARRGEVVLAIVRQHLHQRAVARHAQLTRGAGGAVDGEADRAAAVSARRDHVDLLHAGREILRRGQRGIRALRPDQLKLRIGPRDQPLGRGFDSGDPGGEQVEPLAGAPLARVRRVDPA